MWWYKMKLNNKGVSLVEIIIAVALISIVLIFLYNLLLDVNDELTNSTFAINNQTNRLEIINTVQKDLLKDKLKTVTLTNPNSNQRSISLVFENSATAVLIVEKKGDLYEIKYTSKTGELTKWTLKDLIVNMDNIKICQKSLSLTENIYALKLIIYVYTVNDNNSEVKNNALDDIVINYMGENTGTLNGLSACF